MQLYMCLVFAALLGSSLAQSVSPNTSPSTSPSTSACTTLVLNGTKPFDIFLLGEPANASASPSASPAASSSPAASPSSSSLTMNLTNTLIGGTAAVNGNALLFNSLIGSTLNCGPAASSSPAASPAISSSPTASSSPSASTSANVTLLVIGNLNTTNSRVACDAQSLQVGANASQSIDFEAVRAQLLNVSRDLCQLESSGIEVDASQSGVLSLTLSQTNNSNASSSSSELLVINVNASDLATLRFLSINASLNSSSSSSNATRRSIVINVLGTTTANATSSSANTNTSSAEEEILLRSFGMSLNGLNSTQLLWNFCNATNINVQFLRLMGSVLAPNARLRLSNAGHEGSIAARSLDASFTSQNPAPFEGFFCPAASASPTPSTSASPSP